MVRYDNNNSSNANIIITHTYLLAIKYTLLVFLMYYLLCQSCPLGAPVSVKIGTRCTAHMNFLKYWLELRECLDQPQSWIQRMVRELKTSSDVSVLDVPQTLPLYRWNQWIFVVVVQMSLARLDISPFRQIKQRKIQD